jgi:mono/diheme cytochrome c family protein
MSLSRLAMIAIASGALVTACGKTEPVTPVTPRPAQSVTASPTPDEFAGVRATFAKDCAVCHGDTGEGKTAVIDGKKIKAPPLRSGHALKHSDEDFLKQIVKGGEGMPAFEKKMSPKEIDEMIHFIRREFQAGGRTVSRP